MLKFCDFVCPSNITAFNACDAVNAYDELPANCDDTDDCMYIQDMNINIPEFLFSEIEQLVTRDLGVMIQIPNDKGQNAQSVTS